MQDEKLLSWWWVSTVQAAKVSRACENHRLWYKLEKICCLKVSIMDQWQFKRCDNCIDKPLGHHECGGLRRWPLQALILWLSAWVWTQAWKRVQLWSACTLDLGHSLSVTSAGLSKAGWCKHCPMVWAPIKPLGSIEKSRRLSPIPGFGTSPCHGPA